MPAVKTASLIDGMVVAEPVVVDGATVLAAGTVIAAEVTEQLAAAGIQTDSVTAESFGLAAMFVDGALAPRPGTTVRPRTPTRGATQTTVRARPRPAGGTTAVQGNLMRVAHMFEQHRDSAVMLGLCRLAIKSAQEGRISV